MRSEIVHDDDVAGLQGRHEELLDIGAESFTVYGSFEHAWRGELIAAQRADKGQRAPAPVRREAAQAPAFRPPAPERRHVGPDPRLVDEHEPFGIEPALPGLPALAMAGDIGAGPLKSEQTFF